MESGCLHAQSPVVPATGDYASAVTAASSGISSTTGDALVPHGTSQGVDLNQNYDFFRLTRTGDAGFDDAYLPVLMQSRIGSANTKPTKQRSTIITSK